MDDASDDDRRAEVRAPIELKVEYKRLNAFFADYTKNISRGGTFIKTGRPLPIGTEFLFKLFVPQLERALEIHGEVQWIVTEAEVAAGTHEEAGMGIRFVYREGASKDEVHRVVEKMMVDSLGQRLYTRLMHRDGGSADATKAGAGSRKEPAAGRAGAAAAKKTSGPGRGGAGGGS